MTEKNSRVLALALLAPLGWGALCLVMFRFGLQVLPGPRLGGVPNKLWIWLVCLACLIPLWRYVLALRFERGQRNLRFGNPRFLLSLAYLSALSAVPMHGTWYHRWFVFSVVVSPIIEELFSRHLLSPWLKSSWPKFLALAALSSLTFALMHWGYNSGEAFTMDHVAQLHKLWGHWQFAMGLALIFRFTHSLLLIVVLHAASNLAWVLTNT
ncbi:MAG TPA: CPBP family intramembrane glutamic endopeptidase [Bdellovibrionota bacterium]|jgi:membrane protease YdiL (CAAX protease family)|nr:CPBP family intramembrane glutamic endopeptidase [Bdellovibrionota bacterium]